MTVITPLVKVCVEAAVALDINVAPGRIRKAPCVLMAFAPVFAELVSVEPPTRAVFVLVLKVNVLAAVLSVMPVSILTESVVLELAKSMFKLSGLVVLFHDCLVVPLNVTACPPGVNVPPVFLKFP